MSYQNNDSFAQQLRLQMAGLFMQHYFPNVACSSSYSDYQTSAYYNALCNSSQGSGGSYGNNGGYNQRPITGTYNNASWSSDYLI